ncbi:MAG: Dyp-type peroxidase [Nannocystaceae bacterium]|nr:Dyp-type peroxidase [Nannocystaceae bacterium]
MNNTTSIALGNVQSIVLRGYRVLEAHPYQHYAYLRIADPGGARAWLQTLLPAVTSCTQFDEGERPFALAVAFTHAGLRKLDVPTGVQWPAPFSEGMVARADRLGDDGKSAPQRWTGALGKASVDVLVSIAGADRASIEAGIHRVEVSLGKAVVRVGRDDAAHLRDKPAGTEHFGYVDGIGQPYVEGSGLKPWKGEGVPEKGGKWAPVRAGEFVLGYPIEPGSLPRSVHAFQKDGSYFALRKLSENVASFRDYLAGSAKVSGLSQELLAAKMVGRWRSGAPLVLAPKHDEPALATDPARNNDFHYRDDAKGHACPFGAHIRRANPRDDPSGPTELQVRSHRIIRRALPYGPWLPEGTTDEVDRGVMFGVINTDLENQFEYVQRNWMNASISSRQLSIEADKDPLIGNHDGTGKLVIQGASKPSFCWDLPRFVETRGGAYFFVPSLSALAQLAEESA